MVNMSGLVFRLQLLVAINFKPPSLSYLTVSPFAFCNAPIHPLNPTSKCGAHGCQHIWNIIAHKPSLPIKEKFFFFFCSFSVKFFESRRVSFVAPYIWFIFNLNPGGYHKTWINQHETEVGESKLIYTMN